MELLEIVMVIKCDRLRLAALKLIDSFCLIIMEIFSALQVLLLIK